MSALRLAAIAMLLAFVLLAPIQRAEASKPVRLFLRNNSSADTDTVASATSCLSLTSRQLGLGTSPGSTAKPGDSFDPAGVDSFESLGSQGAITIPVGKTVSVSIWANSGPCTSASGDQEIDWSLRNGTGSGPIIASGSFVVPGNTIVPAGFNSTGTTTGTFTVPAGGNVTLTVSCFLDPVIFYDSPNGQGKSWVQIPTT